MEATIQITGKKAAKVLGAACLATGVVALSAVIASGAAVAAVAEGFKAAKDTVQKIMKKDETTAADETVSDNIDKAAVAETMGRTDVNTAAEIADEVDEDAVADTADSINETAAADEVLAEVSNMTEIATEEL